MKALDAAGALERTHIVDATLDRRPRAVLLCIGRVSALGPLGATRDPTRPWIGHAEATA